MKFRLGLTGLAFLLPAIGATACGDPAGPVAEQGLRGSPTAPAPTPALSDNRIPPGDDPRAYVFEELGPPSAPLKQLQAGECVLHYRRWNGKYTPIPFEPKLSGGSKEPSAGSRPYVMYFRRNGVVAVRALCLINASQGQQSKLRSELAERMQQPALARAEDGSTQLFQPESATSLAAVLQSTLTDGIRHLVNLIGPIPLVAAVQDGCVEDNSEDDPCELPGIDVEGEDPCDDDLGEWDEAWQECQCYNGLSWDDGCELPPLDPPDDDPPGGGGSSDTGDTCSSSNSEGDDGLLLESDDDPPADDNDGGSDCVIEPDDVILSLSPVAVEPGAPTTVSIQVLPENATDYTVHLSVTETPQSGGHAHIGRPLGQFGEDTFSANGDGAFQTSYRASLFEGEEVVSVTVVGSSSDGITLEQVLDVRVAGLSALPGGSSYDNTYGQTTSHPDNHYGTSTTNAGLIAIANDYSALYNGDILRYNDMSLERGGWFDINGSWTGAHAEHRIGLNTDVSPLNVPSARYNVLEDLFVDHGSPNFLGLDHAEDAPHWHLRF